MRGQYSDATTNQEAGTGNVNMRQTEDTSVQTVSININTASATINHWCVKHSCQFKVAFGVALIYLNH